MHKLLTVDEAKELYRIANEVYFDGKLPKPRFSTTNNLKALAMYTYSGLSKKKGVYTIYVSTRYKIDTSEYLNIILHEMIHIYVHLKFGPTFFQHGKRFKELATFFNDRYSTNIRKKIESDKYSLA